MKTTLFRRIFLPTLLLLLLLPISVTVIFRQTAQKTAFAQAQENLQALQEEALNLAQTYYPNENTVPDKTKVSEFLRKTGQLVRRARGDAQLLVFSAEETLVFPADEPEDSEVYALALTVMPLLQQHSAATQTVQAADKQYLLYVFTLSERSLRTRYAVVYCPVSEIGTWVNTAAAYVLLLSFGFAILLMIAVFLIARSVQKPVHSLCKTADRIAQGDYAAIDDGFAVKELDTLRRSVNSMSAQLQSAEDSKKVFFQNISHDLRTPLMSIGGYAQGIETGILPDEKQAAHVIVEESQRLTGMVNELLELSRMTDASVHVQKKLFSPVEVLQKSVECVSGAAREHGIHINLRLPAKKITCIGDDAMLEKILDNLLSNAVRHAHSIIDVTASLNRVIVCDDGDGIDPADLPHLFDRGYKGKNGHLGFGLSIAQTAAQTCGWTLSAANAKDGGAVFCLQF